MVHPFALTRLSYRLLAASSSAVTPSQMTVSPASIRRANGSVIGVSEQVAAWADAVKNVADTSDRAMESDKSFFLIVDIIIPP
ncbi:hypothetical protein D3C78_1484350 [compost metagenome]